MKTFWSCVFHLRFMLPSTCRIILAPLR